MRRAGCFIIFAGLAAVLLVSGCAGLSKQEKIATGIKNVVEADTIKKDIEKEDAKEISLATEDNINLKATFYQKESAKAVILVHMLNSNRQSYNGFAPLLNKQYGILAVDLRGHGQSELRWKDFSDKDFNNMVLDIKAARDFLVEKGFSEIYLIGASIGANAALNYAAADNAIKKVVLLSPGLDYRGVSTKDSIMQYKNKILIVASEEDSYSFSSSQKMFSDSSGEKKFIKLSKAGHGTAMFSGTNLMQEIIDWLE